MKKLQQPHNPARPTSPTSILALFARGREIGFVILEKGRISRYGVKTVRGKKKQSPDLIRRLNRILAPVLAMAGPHSVIVIERDASPSRKGVLCRAVHRLSGQWQRRGYKVCSVSWKEIRERLCECREVTQREVSWAVVYQRHPLLWPLVKQSATHQAKYWRKVLLAAALAEVVHQR
jgi:hypothetical protein